MPFIDHFSVLVVVTLTIPQCGRNPPVSSHKLHLLDGQTFFIHPVRDNTLTYYGWSKIAILEQWLVGGDDVVNIINGDRCAELSDEECVRRYGNQFVARVVYVAVEYPVLARFNVQVTTRKHTAILATITGTNEEEDVLLELEYEKDETSEVDDLEKFLERLKEEAGHEA